jgi:pentapeptide MXKDX repeat protein
MLVVAVSGLTAVGASAQTTGPAGQQTMKTTDPMNANARMHHRRHHHMMKKGTMKGDMSKDGMKKDGMMKDGMKQDDMKK